MPFIYSSQSFIHQIFHIYHVSGLVLSDTDTPENTVSSLYRDYIFIRKIKYQQINISISKSPVSMHS